TPTGQGGDARRPNPSADRTGAAGTARPARQQPSRYVKITPKPRTPGDTRPPRRQPMPPPPREQDGDQP
ncbi:MAG: hypothetical protein L0H79_20585, partial [Intrasporangium sp.]|nr:hypothetical protein [Intrasporangium sp.]